MTEKGQNGSSKQQRHTKELPRGRTRYRGSTFHLHVKQTKRKLQLLAEVSIPASLSNPRLVRSDTKISTNTPRPPFDGKPHFRGVFCHTLTPQMASAPAGRTMHGGKMQNMPLSRIRHDYFSSLAHPPTFGCWLCPPAAASAAYFLPLPLLAERSAARSHARHHTQSAVASPL